MINFETTKIYKKVYFSTFFTLFCVFPTSISLSKVSGHQQILY